MHVVDAIGKRSDELNGINTLPDQVTRVEVKTKFLASAQRLGLDAVKDLVLDWPDAAERHPWLIMNATEMSRAAQADPDALGRLTNEQAVKSLEDFLARLGEFDLMRRVGNLAGQYDVIIDSDLVTHEQRKILRARMAYLAYYAASPANWSSERGYRSGNPNMTIAHTLNQGVLACLLKDHPMARQWSEGAEPADARLARQDGRRRRLLERE